MMRWTKICVAGCAAAMMLVSAGCGGGAAVGPGGKLPPGQGAGVKSKTGQEVVEGRRGAASIARSRRFLEHDKKQDWARRAARTSRSSSSAASEEQESAAGKHLPEALYNAGLSYQRCGKDKEAREHFEATLKARLGFHRARARTRSTTTRSRTTWTPRYAHPDPGGA